MTQHNRMIDLRGVNSLAVDAALATTDIVESLHQTITSLNGLLDDPWQTRTKGMTGLFYRYIRLAMELVAQGIDIPLARLGSMFGDTNSYPRREGVVAALNGILGNHLAATQNPLTISMQFRRDGRPLTSETVSEIIQQSNGRLLIMVHGLCMNDLQWQRQGHDHGAALARDLDFAPLYLHYNSGLHISENGQAFSELLESLVEQSPQPLELAIVAHSMGGLVTRSACYYGQEANHTWLGHLEKMVFLGTPHHGAPLEKWGNWVDSVLSLNPFSEPFSGLVKIRSCGVTDLRYGNLLNEDWQGQDRFELSVDRRTPVPLPDGVACYAFAANTSLEFKGRGEDLVGDGLVTVNSALGQDQKAMMTLCFPETHQWVGENMNHMDLLNHPDVYAVIKKWLEE